MPVSIQYAVQGLKGLSTYLSRCFHIIFTITRKYHIICSIYNLQYQHNSWENIKLRKLPLMTLIHVSVYIYPAFEKNVNEMCVALILKIYFFYFNGGI